MPVSTPRSKGRYSHLRRTARVRPVPTAPRTRELCQSCSGPTDNGRAAIQAKTPDEEPPSLTDLQVPIIATPAGLISRRGFFIPSMPAPPVATVQEQADAADGLVFRQQRGMALV